MKSNLLILQARLDSTRLPRKVLRQVSGKPLILHQIDRILTSKWLNDLVVAIPLGNKNDLLASCLLEKSVAVYRGNENDVFSRFQSAIKEHPAEVIIRSTADCPLFMSEVLDLMLEEFDTSDVDYMSNCLPPTFPDGLDIEIFSRSAFQELSKQHLSPKQREHVTLGFYDGSSRFRTMNFANEVDLSHHRWTVDYIEDFNFVKSILTSINPLATFSEVLDFLKNNPKIKNKRSGNLRNISLLEDE